MISIIIPTYNEAENIRKLIPIIEKQLSKINFEIIVVDDNSPDMTWKSAKETGYKNVRVIRRTDERGLSSAVIEGFKKSRGDIIGVLDADLSHPPYLMKELVLGCKKNDIVIASRYVKKDNFEMSIFRKVVSKVATLLARPLVDVKDPMSGYFFFKKKILNGVKLRPTGYKILLEILVKSKYYSFKEVHFTFGKRYHGKSKLGFKVYLDYIVQLFSLYFYKYFRK